MGGVQIKYINIVFLFYVLTKKNASVGYLFVTCWILYDVKRNGLCLFKDRIFTITSWKGLTEIMERAVQSFHNGHLFFSNWQRNCNDHVIRNNSKFSIRIQVRKNRVICTSSPYFIIKYKCAPWVLIYKQEEVVTVGTRIACNLVRAVCLNFANENIDFVN